MNLTWGTCGGNSSWCSFTAVNLAHPFFDGKEGVYIIWQGRGPVIRIGQGVIRDRLNVHRSDSAITAYKNLYVTWAVVSTLQRDGVERYLTERLNPVVGERHPITVTPIVVNLPSPDWPY